MSPPDEQPRAGRRALRGALYAALLIVGVFVAWQVHRFWSDRRADRRELRDFPDALRYRRDDAGAAAGRASTRPDGPPPGEALFEVGGLRDMR
ncbi:MAG: hypothetical protein ACOC8F_06410, partial [Planctomycetota bacterium]